jgi:uracil-DNA glycosylase family 4
MFDGQMASSHRAILFVGQSPGLQEDKQGKSFVGWTGQLLEKFVMASHIPDFADVYLSNACRCHPPQDADESQAQIRKCRDYLVEDVAKLQTLYEEVIIMNLGAKAVYATLHLSSLTEALKKQATFSPVLGDKNIRVFSTYHPAILHAGREPGKVRAVETHFSLLLRYLKGEFIPNELKIVPEVLADVPETLPGLVTLDIETYGILEGVEQTVFQPIKSKLVDKIPYGQQIITVSFAWRDGDHRIRTPLYMWRFKAHQKKIREWFRRISKDRIVCRGQNIKFDLLYLKSSGDPELAYWIDPRRLLLDDTLLLSFLLYEQQPEKGLKELSTLFGITDYSGVRVTGKSGNAKSCWDKELHHYNCLDAAATLVLGEELERRIREQYGDTSPKLSGVCAWLRNVIIWDTLTLEANGSAFNVPKLEAYHKQEEARCEELLGEAEALYEMKLAGPGSDGPLRQLMLDCLAEADMMSDSRVMWTGKEKKISIGVENVNLVKDHLPDGEHKKIIAAFQEYKERNKIVSTYTGPLLGEPRRGIVERKDHVGIVYPSWYPVPLYNDRGGSSDDKAGGQIQGRFSCKKPPRQTEPSAIRQCSCSRWPGGTLVECDMSQDHLRMAALLSGDPELMDAYQREGESIHVRTAATIFPELDRNKIKKEHPDEYKLGKTLNFAVIFRCGPGTFQQTALHDVGIELDIGFCALAIRRWAEKHHVYWAWQDKMIDLAARQGYLMLPTGWSRTFGLGQKNIAGQVGEVLNFLHQTPSAQLTHSAQYKIQHELLRYHMRSLICLNIYDSLFMDCYPGEEEAAKEILLRNMNNPPLLKVFEKWVGRTIPWAAELKEYKQ